VSLKEVHMTELRQQMLEELQRRNYSASICELSGDNPNPLC